MNTFTKIVAAAVLTAVSGAGFAAGVTKESIEKAALTAHPGKIESAMQVKKSNKDMWEVKVAGTDGKGYTVYFDTKTGKELKDVK